MTIDTYGRFFYARYMLSIKNRQKGFTLVELLVVIAIIGILASFLLVNFVGVRERARDAQRKSDVKQIQAALEFYRSDNGSYPATLSVLSSGSTKYINAIPKDPTSKVEYDYQPSPNTAPYTRYCLLACLENDNDKDITASATCGSFVCDASDPGDDKYVQTNP